MRPVSRFESRKKPIYDGSLHVDDRVIVYIMEVKYNNNILCTRYTWSSCFITLLLYRVYSRRKQICIVQHVHFEIRKGRSQRSTLYPSMFEDKNCVKKSKTEVLIIWFVLGRNHIWKKGHRYYKKKHLRQKKGDEKSWLNLHVGKKTYSTREPLKWMKLKHVLLTYIYFSSDSMRFLLTCKMTTMTVWVYRL